MGFKEALQSAATATFKAFGNVRETVTYNPYSNPAYDTTTGAVTASAGTSVECEQAFIFHYAKEEIDGTNIIKDDRKIMIAGSHFSTVTPDLKGTITRADNSVWSIEDMSKDPALATYVFQVRRRSV